MKPTHYAIRVSGSSYTVHVPVRVGTFNDAVEAVRQGVRDGDYNDPDDWTVSKIGPPQGTHETIEVADDRV